MNNTNILNKCIEELKKDKPNLEYLRGILETLVEMSSINNYIQSVPNMAVGTFTTGTHAQNAIELSDEDLAQDELIKKYEGGRLAPLQ